MSATATQIMAQLIPVLLLVAVVGDRQLLVNPFLSGWRRWMPSVVVGIVVAIPAWVEYELVGAVTHDAGVSTLVASLSLASVAIPLIAITTGALLEALWLTPPKWVERQELLLLRQADAIREAGDQMPDSRQLERLERDLDAFLSNWRTNQVRPPNTRAHFAAIIRSSLASNLRDVQQPPGD